jgi:streptomycin 3"-adenylyltransferase
MNCFNPVSSDIDILVVSWIKIPVVVREAMADIMLKLAPKAPPKGIEMSVVTLHELKNFKHPMPFEFHFSDSWLERYRNKKVDLSNQDRVDSDLAAHLTIVKTRGVTLYGEPIDTVFPPVPSEYYKASILGDAKDILADMTSNPVYNVLNLCRVWAFLEAGLITHKAYGR